MLHLVKNINRICGNCGQNVLKRLFGSTYEGDGKTTARVISKETENFIIEGFSDVGFLLSTGLRLIGPVIIFPRTVLSWQIETIHDVNEKSLSLFKILCPQVEILVLGYGDRNNLPKEVEQRLREFSKKIGIGLEVLNTERAVTTLNFLMFENRLVGGALIPPTKVALTTYDQNDKILRERKLFGQYRDLRG